MSRLTLISHIKVDLGWRHRSGKQGVVIRSLIFPISGSMLYVEVASMGWVGHMEFDDQRSGMLALPYSRRQLLKSSIATGALAAGLASGLSACSTLPWKNNFTPMIPDWMQQLALGVGAGFIGDILKKGLTKAWSAWGPQVGGSLDEILADGAIAAAASDTSGSSQVSPISTMAAHRFVPGGVGWGHPVPPVIMVQVSQTPQGDPETDLLVAYVTTGHQHVVLQPWAWQTLLSFVHKMTNGQSGASLDIAKAGCALSLLPSAIRPISGQSPEGTVDWITYHSRNGWVEISRVQSSNSSSTGVLTASAIVDSNSGEPLSTSFTLPL